MEEERNFPEIPYNYRLCLKRECPKASTCLRQVAERHMPDDVAYWAIISPKHLASLEGDCPFYRSDKKVTYAKGFIRMLDNLPYNQMRTVISALMGWFGRRSYYRVRKGERLLTPSEQQQIANILKRCGVTTPPTYDAYIESYEW